MNHIGEQKITGDRVAEILRGANRGARDPDIDLLELLTELGVVADSQEVGEILKRLVHDARQD